jgi:hypothetical protein
MTVQSDEGFDGTAAGPDIPGAITVTVSPACPLSRPAASLTVSDAL